jgi:hypothetical protein
MKTLALVLALLLVFFGVILAARVYLHNSHACCRRSTNPQQVSLIQHNPWPTQEGEVMGMESTTFCQCPDSIRWLTCGHGTGWPFEVNK